MQPALFQPFQQGDGSATRKYGGTGLGLMISKQLAEMMGGTIGVESVMGQGSVFWFTVRLALASGVPGRTDQPVPAEHGLPADAASLPPMNILVVEDNESNRVVASMLLEGLGQTPDFAVNGAEALEAVRRKQYDLVFMDCQMPVMDGMEATRRIRAREQQSGRHLPVIAMTASALPEEEAKCRAAGMDRFITKPVPLADLASILSQLAAARQPGPAPAAGKPAAPPPLDMNRVNELKKLSVRHAPELFGQLLGSFLTEVPDRLGKLREAAAAGDRDAFHAVAHSLAGISGNIGATQFLAVARELQSIGKTVPLAGTVATINRLEMEFERARTALCAPTQNEPELPR